MILSINYIADWKYIRHCKAQIEKYVFCKNSTRIEHNYRVGDSVITMNNRAFKYKTPFKGTYETVQTWTNGTITLQTGVLTTIINIRLIKSYKNNTKLE